RGLFVREYQDGSGALLLPRFAPKMTSAASLPICGFAGLVGIKESSSLPRPLLRLASAMTFILIVVDNLRRARGTTECRFVDRSSIMRKLLNSEGYRRLAAQLHCAP